MLDNKEEESLSLSGELKKEKQQKKNMISELDSLKKTLSEMKEDKLKHEKTIIDMKKRIDDLYYEKNEIQSEFEAKLLTNESNLKKEREIKDSLIEKNAKITEKLSKLRGENKQKESQDLHSQAQAVPFSGTCKILTLFLNLSYGRRTMFRQ